MSRKRNTERYEAVRDLIAKKPEITLRQIMDATGIRSTSNAKHYRDQIRTACPHCNGTGKAAKETKA